MARAVRNWLQPLTAIPAGRVASGVAVAGIFSAPRVTRGGPVRRPDAEGAA